MVNRTMTIKQFANFTKKFPSQMEKAGFRINDVLARSYQRRVRGRATGRLKNIEVTPKGKQKISVGYKNDETAKIAKFVNAGIVPQHAIPAQLMEASRAGKKTAGKKARSVLGNLENPIFVMPKRSKSMGFLTKSMETLKRDTKGLMEKELQRTFNEM